MLTSLVNGVGVAELLEWVRREQDRNGGHIRLLQASSEELFVGTTSAP